MECLGLPAAAHHAPVPRRPCAVASLARGRVADHARTRAVSAVSGRRLRPVAYGPAPAQHHPRAGGGDRCKVRTGSNCLADRAAGRPGARGSGAGCSTEACTGRSPPATQVVRLRCRRAGDGDHDRIHPVCRAWTGSHRLRHSIPSGHLVGRALGPIACGAAAGRWLCHPALSPLRHRPANQPHSGLRRAHPGRGSHLRPGCWLPGSAVSDQWGHAHLASCDGDGRRAVSAAT